MVGLKRPMAWLAAAVPLSYVLITLVYFLYAAMELDWSTFDSWWGLLAIIFCPLLAGAAIGISFESMKRAIAVSWGVAGASAITAGLLFAAPYMTGVVEHTEKYSGLAWTAGFLAFLAAMPLAAIGAALATASNVIE